MKGRKLVQSGVWSSSDSCRVTYVSVCRPCAAGWDTARVFRESHQPATPILEPSGTPTLRLCSYLVTVVGDVWLVLSRSWPPAHFLPGGHSDSRVKFIWYPRISAAWKCQVSGIGPLSFDTLVSVMTPIHPYWPSVHLDGPHTHYQYLNSHPNRKSFSHSIMLVSHHPILHVDITLHVDTITSLV